MKAAFLALALLLPVPAVASEIGPDALDSLPPADVVVLGEVHDNPTHHQNQARAVAALQPRALVFEMLTPDQASRARPEIMADAKALEAALGWDGTGWPDFAMYAPIFAAAPAARVHGAAVPRESLMGADPETLARRLLGDPARYGLDQPLPQAEQRAAEAEQKAAHCNALPDEILPRMVAIQRLRDAALAHAAANALAETGGPVVVITGSGHARTDRGMPVNLRAALPDIRILSVGQIEGEAGDEPFDLWIATPPIDRPDPCAGFAAGG